MRVFINGIGAVSETACTSADFAELAGEKDLTAKGQKIEFTSTVPGSKLRRASRYAKLTVSAADLALADSNTEINDPYRIGAVMASGFGSVEYNRQFSNQVQKGDPQLCSPSLFSQSVANSALGNLCMINSIKGEDTMLRGGDPLEYAALLLKMGKADTMLCGETEEWSEELLNSFAGRDTVTGCTFSEGAAFGKGTEMTDLTYCEISGFSSANLGLCPLLEKSVDIKESLKKVYRQLSYSADIIFTAANGTWFDDAEADSIRDIFGDIPLYAPKKLFGESFGCSYMLSVCLAAAAIKNGSFKGTPCSSVIVSGFDMAGNYIAVKLTGVKP
ncbi:beta-ketoacyl synthase chain length factor [uncultured Ruminococcus sp.]|uniref:beta-ketoacyl synthase chain length factor n=1 Tax=uncultured Ruminococcus sp. TaxID=165186 RepID=UPI0025D4B2DD|nr:beta-ketoacyl synthase chain length factor [uncultured Ruminococcus sp.]